MNEKVKKLLKEKMALERCDPDVMPYFTDYYWIPKDQVTELTQQICQLFEPKPDEVDLYQVVGHGGEVDDSDMTMEETEAAILAIIKPDEGRLLTDEEFYNLWMEKFNEFGSRRENLMFLSDYKTFKCDYEIAKSLVKAQDARTTSVLRREYDKLVLEAHDKGYDRAKAEWQERVERIFRWSVEPCPHWVDVPEKVIKRDCALCWQALKKKEGVK